MHHENNREGKFTVYLIINACLKTLTDLKNTEVESVLACKEKEFMIEVFIQIKRSSSNSAVQ